MATKLGNMEVKWYLQYIRIYVQSIKMSKNYELKEIAAIFEEVRPSNPAQVAFL